MLFVHGFDEDTFRYAGLVLQMMGFAITARSLASKRLAFGRPGLSQRIRQHWRNRPHFPRTVYAELKAQEGSSDEFFGRGTVLPSRSSPVEHRLSVLEQNLQDLSAEIGQLSQDYRTSKKEIVRMLRDESKSRKNAVETLDRRVSGVLVGGLGMESVGVLVFAIGVMLSTVPSEISCFLRYFL